MEERQGEVMERESPTQTRWVGGELKGKRLRWQKMDTYLALTEEGMLRVSRAAKRGRK